MRFVFPGFASFSEFYGYNGSCGEDAALMALHCVDAQKWPLTPAALDALIKDAEAHGYTLAPNGESNIPGIDGYLSHIGVRHSTVGYNAFTLDKLHAQLKQLASATPTDRQLVIVEWSAAGKGLHDDEANVLYHYSTFGGIDTGVKNDGVGGGYLRGDGDSNTDNRQGKATAPILTPWQSIVNAKPIGFICVPVPVPTPPPPPPPAPKPPTPNPVDVLTKELADANATIATLQSQIAALKAAAAQPPAPSDPIAAKTLAAMQQFKAVLGEL